MVQRFCILLPQNIKNDYQEIRHSEQNQTNLAIEKEEIMDFIKNCNEKDTELKHIIDKLKTQLVFLENENDRVLEQLARFSNNLLQSENDLSQS